MTSDIVPEAGPQPGARALASRRNGARSRGPKTAAGLARSSGNALKHGLRARRQVLLADEDAAEYRAFQAAARAELAPIGALQSELAARIVTTAWRARRAARRSGATLVVAAGSQPRSRPPCSAAISAPTPCTRATRRKRSAPG
jgi:hypothetical protein